MSNDDIGSFDERGRYVMSMKDIVDSVSGLSKKELVSRLKGVRSVELDFTDQYYEAVSVATLRHVYLAVLDTTIKRR